MNCYNISIDPKYVDAMMSLANTLSVNGNNNGTKEAIHILEKANQLKPFDSDVLNNYASLLNKLGECCLLVFALQSTCSRYIILNSIPHAMLLLLNLWDGPNLCFDIVSLTTDYHSNSIAIYEQALQHNPHHYIAMSGLARVLRKIGQNDKAEELFKRLMQVANYFM